MPIVFLKLFIPRIPRFFLSQCPPGTGGLVHLEGNLTGRKTRHRLGNNHTQAAENSLISQETRGEFTVLSQCIVQSIGHLKQ